MKENQADILLSRHLIDQILFQSDAVDNAQIYVFLNARTIIGRQTQFTDMDLMIQLPLIPRTLVNIRLLACLVLLARTAVPIEVYAESTDASAIIQAAIDHWRDSSSYTRASMKVHRPDWERSMSFVAWTKDRNRSLVRFTAPARDRGSASLTIDNNIWSYSPKINKVIKIPPSMMGQSWMGSDFSYQDLARSDDLIEHYKHILVSTETIDQHQVFTIDSLPLEDSPIVWGKEQLKIRSDHIILTHEFFDQDMNSVKLLTTGEVKLLGGKLFPTLMRMTQKENPDEWTELIHHEAQFGQALPGHIFTQSNLRNPRMPQ